MSRLNVNDIRQAKGRDKIVMVTAYDFPTAQVIDQAGVDIVLVGDSLGTVVLGYETTLPVTIDDLIRHTTAVARGVNRALVVADLPFLTFGVSVEETLHHAGRCLKEAGAQAVKIEGGEAMAGHVSRMTAIGIPVMGHLGLTPQSIHSLGGLKVQARTEEAANRLIKEAVILERAGIFALVLEAVPSDVARQVTTEVGIPTIGIGAGPLCDGQVLVFHDLVGWSPPDFAPKFVKRYADVRGVMAEAVKEFAAEVRAGVFPDKAHSYGE